ncbi:hypothetical protein QYF36_016725 [Acer negundo]|nr:hypothetical protein QYF36_016725 [Acer negundo]
MNMDIPQEKLGPWGGNKGIAWDDGRLLGRIKQIDVHEGNGVIHAIDCQYESNNNDCNSSSSVLSSSKHGGEGASIIHRIDLDKDKCSPEYLVGISGFHGPVDGNRCVDQVVRSISFYTDQGKHGPFGLEIGTSFHSPVCTNAKVVGFHGTSGEYLDAIGVHVQY